MSRMTFWIFLGLSAFSAGCASRYSPADSYSEQVRIDADAAKATAPKKNAHNQTVVFFLIDGLSVPVLQRELRAERLPNLARHFRTSEGPMLKAHSVFPSLTFPNISSLLHERPVHRTGNVGNSMVVNRRLLDFESILDRAEFGKLMAGDTIFTRLQAKGLRSVSLDYGLGVDATVATDPVDIKVGTALQLQDYLYLDQKKIDSLKILFEGTPTEHWPDFVFVHLIGVDFLSHMHGPESAEAFGYLRKLDAGLGELFQLMRQKEGRGHRVISMLSSDHGFPLHLRKNVPIEKLVQRIRPDFKVLNEVRFAALYAAKAPTSEQLSRWGGKLLKEPGIGIVVTRKGTRVTMASTEDRLSFDYISPMDCPVDGFGVSVEGAPALCLSALPAGQRDRFGPFFVSNMAAYFQAEKYPDLLVLADEHTVFKPAAVTGYHGGTTRDEIIVPLLMRNATLQAPDRVPALWELLQFL